jgi:hypothetical protein
MPMKPRKDDPRSIAEKARADLKANNEMGLAPPESPAMTRPSVTPETFGAMDGYKDDAPGSDDDALSRAKE